MVKYGQADGQPHADDQPKQAPRRRAFPLSCPCTVLCGRSPHDIEWQEVGNVAITEDLFGKRASREGGSSGHEQRNRGNRTPVRNDDGAPFSLGVASSETP